MSNHRNETHRSFRSHETCILRIGEPGSLGNVCFPLNISSIQSHRIHGTNGIFAYKKLQKKKHPSWIGKYTFVPWILYGKVFASTGSHRVFPRHLEATKRRSRRRCRTRWEVSVGGGGWVLTPAPNEQGVWVENGSKEIYSPGKWTTRIQSHGSFFFSDEFPFSSWWFLDSFSLIFRSGIVKDSYRNQDVPAAWQCILYLMFQFGSCGEDPKFSIGNRISTGFYK